MLHSSFSASFRLSFFLYLFSQIKWASALLQCHNQHTPFSLRLFLFFKRISSTQHVCGNKITPKNFIIVPYQYIYISILGKDVQNNFGRSDKLKIVNEEVGWWVRRVTVRLMRWSQRLRASPSPPLRDLICWATRIN